MQNKFIKKYAPLLMFGVIFYSGSVNAEENLTISNTSSDDSLKTSVEVEHEENEGMDDKNDDRLRFGAKDEERKLKLDQKMEDRKIKIEDRKIKMEENKADFEKRIEDKKIKFEEKKEGKKVEIEAKREEMLKNVLEKRKEFELKKEALKTEMKSKADAAKEALKKTLGIMKDEKKKASVENIANIIDNANKNTGTRFTNTVNSVENVLVSIKSRSEKVGATGADTTAVLAEISKAEALITEARTAISTQSAKVYTIDVTDSTKVKEAMKATRDLFNADIKAVQEKVKLARDGVKKAADVLKKTTPKPAPAATPVTTEANVEATVNTTN
ncbi:MAG: hypothetical protein WC089_00935 [Candidatus Paceibacterota bacterium]